jgi:CO/xanthine dehydrogenase Mo-binding subunit
MTTQTTGGQSNLGVSFPRKDAPDKTTGRTRYTDDFRVPGMLYAAVVNSRTAHGTITAIDDRAAREMPGVRGVFSGRDFPQLVGLYLGDKPALAVDRVRYFGEPVVAVVADDERTAQAAAASIRVSYEELPVIRSPRDGMQPDAPIIHPEMERYVHIPAILPEPGTNIAHHTRMRKGDPDAAFASADAVVEGSFRFPPKDHAAMEPRVAVAEIRSDGQVIIRTSTQSPYGARGIMSRTFGIPPGKLTIQVAEIGGGFGGKAGIQLEPLAYLLSKAVGGRPVRVQNTREQDMVGSPGGPGLEATVKLAARRDGTITGAIVEFLFDSGGYADYAVNVSRAAGYASTGPYNIPNLRTDSYCVYTNHPFATAYRGFGHIEMSYAIERGDGASRGEARHGSGSAATAQCDPARRRDTIPGRPRQQHRGPSGMPGPGIAPYRLGVRPDRAGRRVSRPCKRSLVLLEGAGDPDIYGRGSARELQRGRLGQSHHRGGRDGTGNLHGARPDRRGAAADAPRPDPRRAGGDDRPFHSRLTSAASRTLFMVGRAAIAAVDDAVLQIKRVASAPLRAPEEDLEVAAGRVFIRDEPSHGLPLADVVLGYVYPDGNAIGGPVIGRGKYIARHLTHIDPETGKGRPGLEWTLGAMGVEIEVNLRDGTFRVLTAVCSMDVGKVINPALARGQVVGAMAMGIGYTTREAFLFDSRERVLNYRLRDYKLLRYGEHPEYIVDFVETPQGDGPFGARGLGEQGIIGMPGALSAAFSRAVGVQLNALPITPEYVWRSYHAGRDIGWDAREAAE